MIHVMMLKQLIVSTTAAVLTMKSLVSQEMIIAVNFSLKAQTMRRVKSGTMLQVTMMILKILPFFIEQGLAEMLELISQERIGIGS